ncbi:MAG: DNA-binding protein [Bdellovibrio sp. CG12_big_fil_rev_8_21_14_0_65_39_13]|nr:MAG: DNA-binding protein [Bdellovibrio sp. CG22_combo_CG10-13_8_21_14_all_39_27]PIQ58000.1 MAG: DNA-binding protein [Bdellovibrio sp. CG12_big_fil_rev_8_21_14_0_65_39_13]PIR36910.1 MAG: DNA-binding protein [Bdellovibrio sp. CG11_big_fil_rev_8_21_14_0_20_39_38]
MHSNSVIVHIDKMIYNIRGQKVMIDSDLAQIYGVVTKAFNQAVQRNRDRFPEDFMFQCTLSDLDDLRSQIVTANSLNTLNYKRRNLPYVFTENGVAMLSSVLNSKEAIQINIAIMRIFTKLRSFHALESQTDKRVDRLEKETHHLFKTVFKKLDEHEKLITPHLPKNREKIGIK